MHKNKSNIIITGVIISGKKKKIMWENYNLIKLGLQINLVSRKFKIIIIIIYINWLKNYC